MNFYFKEDKKLLSLIKKQKATILDVGCGHGRFLKPLSELGHYVVGVDISINQVSKLKEIGYEVYTPEEFDNVDLTFDYIIMSHIIEHIPPFELIGFLDMYLDKLKYGGELIIATPFLYDEFYDDFDHIKPYTPKALSVLYSDYEQQSTKPKHRLKLKYVWLRKWPIVFHNYPGSNFLKTNFKKLLNKIFFLLYYITFEGISRTTGWIGVYEKIR